MKTAKILTILVLALGLMVCSAPIVHGAQYLTVNKQPVDSIILEVGQSCFFEEASGDSGVYTDVIGFEDCVVLGSFLHYKTTKEAGDSARVTPIMEHDFYGYEVTASGSITPPSPGTHFIFEYQAQEPGETDLVLKDGKSLKVLDSVHIRIVPDEMGTAFTYQGRLIDSSTAADGEYDFEFELYDAPFAGGQLGSTIDVNDLDVIDGYFTVELDFGSDVFDGNAVWLEIGVRPGDSNDPNAYTTLTPRQELTPSPYAGYAKTAGSIVGGVYGGGTTDYIAKFTDSNTIGDSAIYERSGNVAIGTTMITGRKLGVLASHSYAGHFHNTYTGGGDAFAVYGRTDGTGGWDRFGLYGLATGGSQNNYGVYGIAYGDEGINYGLYGRASGQGSNYAAYLDGDVMILQGNLYVTSADKRVGIGTRYPTEALTISSNSTSRTAIRLQNTSSAERYNYNIQVRGSLSSARDGNLEIWRNDTYGNPSQVGVVIQPDGDVGIGTTTPGSKLQVAGMVHSTSGGFKFPDGTTQTTAASGDGHSLDASDGSPTNVVYVNSIGNVGVGTTSPAAKLDVEGYIQTQDNLPFSVRRYSGTLGGIGTVTFSHGITNGHHKGLIVQAWCKGNANEMIPMDVEYMDGGNIRIINGIANRPYRVTIIHTSISHVW